MNVTGIQIDSHGPWKNVALPVHPRGLSVFYGPNEAGKTAVRGFIRGVLYGFAPGEQRDGAAKEAGQGSAGALTIEDSAGSHRIHRNGAGLSADARLMGDESARLVDDVLAAALTGVDSHLFDRVFSFGLRELTEFSSLSEDRVAPYLYGATLGPEGERILEAARRADERRSRLVDPLQSEGELVRLFERHDELSAELRQVSQLRDRHGEWCLRRDQLEGEIADLRRRHSGTQSQLRGHEFLERAWGPWNQIRECRRELDSLPEIPEFPERGMQRLERLEYRIAGAVQERKRLMAEVRQSRSALAAPAGEASWKTHAGAMRGFVEQRSWFAELDERCRQAEQALGEREESFLALCGRLGEGWTAEQVAAADVSAAGQRKLAGTAQSLLAARSRRKRLKAKLRQTLETGRDLKESLAERLADLGDRPIEAALSAARSRLGQLTELAVLKLREVELGERLTSLRQNRERIVPQLTLPKWVYVVLGLFAFMGVILAGWGLVAGVATSSIAGAIYVMLGVTCGGLAWGLRIQYEGDAKARLAEVETDAAAADTELARVQDSIQRLGGSQDENRLTKKGGLAPSDAPDPPDESTRCEVPVPLCSTAPDQGELVGRVQAEINDLLDLAASQRRLTRLRRRLAGLKKKLETARREVATAREHWNELLAGLGLPVTAQPDQALAVWQNLAEAAERLRVWESARREFRTLCSVRDAFRERIVELARRIDGQGPDRSTPPLEIPSLEILDAWEERLSALERRQIECRELRKSISAQRRQVRRQGRRVRAFRSKRDALLVQGGAAGRDEFEQRARAFARSTLLTDQLHDARRELDAACAGHSDMALAEEDLERFEPRENGECIRMLRLERADLERDLEQALEHLGGVKHEIESLENDRQATRIRFEMRQVEDALHETAREWLCCESAAQVIDDIRRDFERTHQPQALAAAAKIFSRLTAGKYVRVWTPLGARRLIVEDAHGRSFPVQALSRGAREQLLLAVRLAVVLELREQGISLPVILDDVLVNFDEQRASAAADVLVELAEQGQQVLFLTCHKHIAQLFASRGIEPTWLPDRADLEPQPAPATRVA